MCNIQVNIKICFILITYYTPIIIWKNEFFFDFLNLLYSFLLAVSMHAMISLKKFLKNLKQNIQIKNLKLT